MTDEDRARRRSAKLINERLKLVAAFCNTLGVATLVASVIAPFFNDRALSLPGALLAFLVALVLHGGGQLMLLGWRSED